MLLNISVYYFEDFCINYIHSVLSEILRSEFIILFSLLNEKKDVNIAVPEVQMIIEWGHFHYFPFLPQLYTCFMEAAVPELL